MDNSEVGRTTPAYIGATLEQVCADLDHRSPTGSSGVTPSMLSGWERGRHTTTRRYRTLLADYYHRTVDDLFTHQDGAATAKDTPQLVSGPRELRQAMMEVARAASPHLAVAGSRSRDAAYLFLASPPRWNERIRHAQRFSR